MSKNYPLTKLWNIVDIKTWKIDVNANVSGWKYPFFTCAREVYEIDTYAFEWESILIAWNGDLNIKYYDGKFNAYQRTYVLQNFKADGKYLYYVLENNLKLLRSGSRWSTIKYIRLGDLTEMKIPLPPLPTQHLIVSEIEKQFSRLDDGLSSLLKIRQNLKSYRASILKSAIEWRLTEEWRKEQKNIEPASALLMHILEERKWKFLSENPGKKYKESEGVDSENLPNIVLPEGWCWTKVENITQLQEYWSSKKASETWDVPVLRMWNIQDWKLDFTKLKYYKKENSDLKKLTLENLDLLFNRTNSAELVWKSAIYESHHPMPCSFAWYLIRVRTFHDLFNIKFLLYFINSFFGRKWVASVVSQQVWQANVNGTKLSNLIFPLPPISEQQKIVEEVEYRLSVVDELEQTIEAGIKKAENLKQAILKKAFNGELVEE